RIEQIYHVGKTGYLGELSVWIQQRLQGEIDQKLQPVQTGVELWEQCSTLYPSLEFCIDVQKQLQKHASQKDQIKTIRLRLLYLEQYSQQWRVSGGSFNNERLSGNASPESQETLQHPEYGPKRRFQCPDGQRRVFSWHLKLFNGWRIHFYPDEERQTIIVGYIGPHLPTVKFHT
ncbi:MAG: hypothetical protein MI924_33620, partial [Chloroflexales bacterium]|nr:hypothetical protein [Chloroflexales bacterium]